MDQVHWIPDLAARGEASHVYLQRYCTTRDKLCESGVHNPNESSRAQSADKFFPEAL